ncbi:MAG: YraN family protein [Candidatus Blackburnbacteria bacterium]|nr:YraN family protein [Candidatus Blackburnbacteria bacterium]
MSTVRAGKLGERIALQILRKKGYKILQRNFRSNFGEIDIVAEDYGTLVFVEVKTRWSKKFGNPEEAVTPRKLRSIIKTGDYYKLTHPNTPNLIRIDVVAIDIEGKKAKARLIRNASL